ncbi:peptide N-acetyl-beta-D-glucosaminyl asparaginase amidase A-domain-containing protein [Mycena rosella]|uniref:Peptide N-acetyl-beta-D-glucosaminyl asparaginase amidase A-domain-containing protein n=1 Tax=Mycena rosella TaxID=1033263 RepID=A0AAD7H1R3_MYCRO|nr:peptide N-acetyl-beta-D-glucosaminyl asparaginase amidase A-domain-containing protein [Mycena rosella]
MLHTLWRLCGLVLAAPAAAVLVDFQVAQPPPVPQDAQQCTIQILQRDFANSFGDAEVVQYTPPTDCGEPGSWAGVTLNFTVTSNGTQFDRLAIFTFQNVEIWRSSTPEPTTAGIIWTYVKDVTRYTPLFAKPGTFILQLDNLLETSPLLNGVYSTTLHATFYASSKAHPPAKRANTIIPLSTLSNTTGNDASVPPSFSINVTLPQNAVEVYAELYPSGNGNEEFWYFNIANQFLPDLPSGNLGQGPFKEVRLLVDNQVAGVAFPYPVIFTGGILPPAWRPITSYGALDLPTYFLDLTPFVPLLTDGQPHLFTIDVASAEADKTILQNWFVSGLLQVVTDSSSKPTTGNMTSYSADPFAVATITGSVGDNGDVNITVSATRKIHITSEIRSGSGHVNSVVWSQDLQYINQQNYLDNTLVQNLFQTSSGTVLSTHNGVPAVMDTFSYPIEINITSLNSAGSTFTAAFDHSYDRVLLPSPFILGSTIKERQVAGGIFVEASTGNTGNGTSNNTFTYSDLAGNTFNRQVDAAFNNITLDVQSGSLSTARKPPAFPSTHNSGIFAGARLPPGRGK